MEDPSREILAPSGIRSRCGTGDGKGATAGRPIHLRLGQIDDADEVFINGVKIGTTGGGMPPHYESAWDTHRVYRVPGELLRSGSGNRIAVRVYDQYGGGGMMNTGQQFYALNVPGPIKDLMGWWELSTTDDTNYRQGIAAAEGFTR